MIWMYVCRQEKFYRPYILASKMICMKHLSPIGTGLVLHGEGGGGGGGSNFYQSFSVMLVPSECVISVKITVTFTFCKNVRKNYLG